MDRIEEEAILECLRDMHVLLSLGHADTVAGALVTIDPAVNKRRARDCIEGKYIALAERSRVANAALVLLQPKRALVKDFYEKKNKHTARYLQQILTLRTRSVDVIFDNWSEMERHSKTPFISGIYQIFRRYKPTRTQRTSTSEKSKNDWSKDINHVVICELIHIDSETMECIVVTSEMNVYYGSLCINHEDTLYGILQRKNPRNGGIHQRFIASKLERPALPIYSGICIKTGDTTRRPLASECLYVRIPESHADLYEQFEIIGSQTWKLSNVPGSSVISQYITNPPRGKAYDERDPDWALVKFIRDFPSLALKSEPDKSGMIIFREPSRAVSPEQLIRMAAESPLGYFRHDDWSPDKDAQKE